MIYADDFINSLGSHSLKEYYFGNISHGKYNDNTGKTYLLKYIEKEKIHTLYIGKFENNLFSDNTGRAWHVELNDEVNYLYFKGKFKNNIPLETSNNKRENILIEEIYRMLAEYNFNHNVFLYDNNPDNYKYKDGKEEIKSHGYIGEEF